MARPRKRASGRFVLRLEPDVHAALRAASDKAGISLNEYCARRLASPMGSTASPDACRAIERARSVFGEQLIGVALFGSWVRGETTDQSDVDLLVVVEGSTRLTRELYRRWDETPITWEGRPVEPQFVHAPDPGKIVAGLWGELAIDGIVLYESQLRVSKQLARIRRDIVSGRITRHASHGQVYWVRNEAA